MCFLIHVNYTIIITTNMDTGKVEVVKDTLFTFKPVLQLISDPFKRLLSCRTDIIHVCTKHAFETDVIMLDIKGEIRFGVTNL